MRVSLRVLMAACLVAVAAATTAFAAERVSLTAREGVATRFDYHAAPNPIAQVILFEGGSGVLTIDGRGFLQGSPKLFASNNISSALFEPPSDRPEGLRGYRFSAKHERDVDAIIAWMREKDPAPIWLVGVSLGTHSVTWVGSRTKQPIAGLVFASAPTVGRASVAERGLDRIRVPSLIVHHKRDTCPDTPASGVEIIEKLLPSDTKREIKLFDGGSNAGRDPCMLGVFHTYSGIERNVLTAIATFIRDNPPR